MKSRVYIILFTACCLVPAQLFAESVYKQIDANGNVSYSSKPPHAGAQPADLPKLTRIEESEPTEQLQTCDSHGGVNCQAGQDTDGSVICFDGFTDASARFNFSCGSARLRVISVESSKEDGALTVIVRNSRSVEADSPTVKVNLPAGKAVELQGPEKIEAFGAGEFSFNDIENELAGVTFSKQHVRVSCRNCD